MARPSRPTRRIRARARAGRAARVGHALTTMGVGITTAAVSTATAGLVMMGSVCVFYYNFGAHALLRTATPALRRRA